MRSGSSELSRGSRGDRVADVLVGSLGRSVARLGRLCVGDKVVTPEIRILLDEDVTEQDLERALEAFDLEKRVAAHPSHTQQRRRGGQFAPQHHARVQPRDEAGRFRQRLTPQECRHATERAGALVAELHPRLQDHLSDLMETRLSVDEAFRRARREIQHYYELVYREGQRAVGNPCIILTPQDRAAVNRLVRDESDYLRAFLVAVDEGSGTMPYVKRMQLYGSAAWEAYWFGWALGDQRIGREIRWRYGKTLEHCGLQAGGHALGCSDFATMGWMPIKRFLSDVIGKGFAPRSGQLECLGIQCDCRLEEQIGGSVLPAAPYPGVS